MSHAQVSVYLRYLWDTFLLLWVVSALAVKRNRQAEPHWSAIGRSLVLGALLYGLFVVSPHWHWLHAHLVPDASGTHWTGMLIAICGMLFACWARFALGANWSSRATIKEGHELIIRGPYRIVRNPIYTGIFFAFVGTAIAFGEVRHFLGIPIVLLMWTWKISNEQRMLHAQFGEEYERYCRDVKAFLPYLI